MVPAVTPLRSLSTARSCARIDSADRVEVHHAWLLAAIGVRKTFPHGLDQKPTLYFVNSMGDLFHESVPDEWIDQVFAVMALTPRNTYQVLTKRAARMREYFNGPYPNGDGVCARIAEATWKLATQLPESTVFVEVPVGPRMPDGLPEFGFRRMMHPKAWPLPNVWLGVSTERQQEADERIPLLQQTPATVRFISAEPLLGPID